MKEAKNPFNITQILLPVAIGLIVIGWLFVSEFATESFDRIGFNQYSVGFFLLAFLLMIGREIGLIFRFRTLADKRLTWKQSFNIHILNEFTSAITPSAVGGSAFVVLFLNKEGISVGRSTSIMITNLFLDELFFVLICPIIFLLVPLTELFNVTSVILATIGVIFWSIYGFLVIWTTLLYIGLFKRPDLIVGLFNVIFRLPLLNHWQNKIQTFSDSLINASNEINSKSRIFWLLAFGTTCLSWIFRFLVANAIFLAFTPISNHLVIFSRQLMLWIAMVASPTPGASGLTEIAFREYYSDLLLSNGSILCIVLIWRVITYYFYLLLGVIFIPGWIKKSFSVVSSS
jgi:uncharacterized protein (TIRG00374 family)